MIVNVSLWGGGSAISAGPQLTAGGTSNSADAANVGPGGSVAPQQG